MRIEPAPKMWGYIMPNAQSYIDALRVGDYSAAKDIVSFVQEKYTRIAEQSLGQDYILPLIIYELCQTDISKNDAKIFHFIAEYLHLNGLAKGLIAYSYMTLMQAFPFAVEIKQHNAFKTINAEIDFEDCEDIEEFVSEDSRFSQLTSEIDKDKREELTDFAKTQLTEQDVSKYIEQMDTKTFQTFHKSMQTLSSENELNCPFINKRLSEAGYKKQLLIDKVNEYKNLLINKLGEQGIDFNENTGQMYSLKYDENNLPKNVNDLLERLEIINNLQIESIDITDNAQVQKVHAAVERCKSYRPAWIERDLLQKITDILSFGIKPLIRALTSKQTKVEKEIEETLATISRFSPGI